MSATVTLPAKEVKECLTSISLVAAKGSQLTPVSLILKNGYLDFVCLQGCVVQCSIQVNTQESAEVVFMFYDATPILPSTGEVELSITEYDVTLQGQDFNCVFPHGYSDVERYDFSACDYQKIDDKNYADGLKTVLGMNLDKFYGKSVPVSVYEDVSVIKHVCCYVQVRTPGLPFTAQLDPEHVKMVTRFAPWEVSTSIADTLVFRRKNSILQIPCRYGIPTNDFLTYLKGMTSKCVVTLGDICDKVREAAKVSNKSKCQITGTPTGLQITISIENASSTISVGDLEGQLQFIYNFPVQVLLTFFKALGSGKVEILTGGELICLRTQSLIILVRADY